MKRLATVGILVCICIHAYAADDPVIDAETRAFSAYISDVSRLDGMFHGVVDYCEPLVPHLIIEQAKAAWRQHNGQYIDAVDLAIERFASARVEPDRKAGAIRQLKENARAWFQEAHDKSKLLDDLHDADNKDFACSNRLGVMSSESFYLKKMRPADDEYWSRNLRP